MARDHTKGETRTIPTWPGLHTEAALLPKCSTCRYTDIFIFNIFPCFKNEFKL